MIAVIVRAGEVFVRVVASLLLLLVGWLVSLFDEHAATPFWAWVWDIAQATAPI